MNRSQENCLIDNHRLTCERWGGDSIHSAIDSPAKRTEIELNDFSMRPFLLQEGAYLSLKFGERFSLQRFMGKILLEREIAHTFIQFYEPHIIGGGLRFLCKPELSFCVEESP